MPLIKNISCLIESSKVINSSLNLSKILNIVTHISKDILSAEAGSLMLIDENTKELVFAVALGEKGNKLKKKVRIKLGEGIAGCVAKTGEPILVKDVAKDTRFSDRVDKFSGFKTRSIMCVPLKVKNKIIGILEAINSPRKGGFSLKDLDIFQAFSCQVAVAIDNAMMHKQVLARQKLDQELQIARQIQQNLLPQAPLIPDIQINAKNIPAKQVGGDLYDFFDLGNDKIGIMISDVSGKGIPAALYMVRVMSEFRFAVKTEEDLGAILSKVNNILIDRTIMGMFVTLFYLIIDKVNMKIDYISAGHPPPLYYTEGKLKYLDKAQNPPLGIMSGIDYKSSQMEFTNGDSILLYTDGVIEVRNKRGEEYSNKRLGESFIKALKKNPIEEIINSLYKHTGGIQPQDDYTLIYVQTINPK